MKQVSVACLYLLILTAVAQKARVRSNESVRPAAHSTSVQNAVEKAASYLLSLRQSDYGWRTAASTARANVALAFAERVSPVDGKDKTLMEKQLNIQLALDLMTPSLVGLSDLALYVNAMYATCQNPRNFQGMDLVSMLRFETNGALRSNSNFTLPFVLMTLCVAGENTFDDNRMLSNIYNTNDRISTRAIAVLAMACVQKTDRSMFVSYIRDFSHRISQLRDRSMDMYTKPLVLQAANAAKLPHNFNLEKNQREDGSFGDLLSTYHAIPAILNISLLDLKCKGSQDLRGRGLSVAAMNPDDKKVTISLRIASNAGYNSHSTDVSFRGNETLFDVLKAAESRDPTYRFHWDETKHGKDVFILADVPNDPEKGMSWRLYKASSELMPQFLKSNMVQQRTGINYIFPQDKSHYVFLYDLS